MRYDLKSGFQQLTDNRNCYTARKIIAFDHSLGFAPVHSTESDGIAKLFETTFTRDYVYVQDRAEPLLR